MIESWVFASGILLPKKIRELGHRFILVTRSPDFYSRYAPKGEEHPVVALADEIVTCDTNDIQELVRVCGNVLGRRKVDGVLSSCDYFIRAVAEVAQTLGLPSSPVDAVSVAVNKYLMRKTLAEKGVPTPKFRLAHSSDDAASAAREIGLPLIVKPADMNGSALVQKANDVDSLAKGIALINECTVNSRNQDRFPGALLEEFLPGEEFSVECCAYGGEVHVLGITDKKLGGRDNVVETGHMFPADIAQQDENAIKKHVSDALNAIGYNNGVAHIEVRLTPQGPRIVEINPRIGGNYISDLVERVTGVSPLTQMIQVALGESPDLPCDENSPRRPKSAAVAFKLPATTGILEGFEGQSAMEQAPGVVAWALSAKGKKVLPPDDNDCYLGHVICIDYDGLHAGDMATEALSRLQPIVDGNAE